MRCWDYLIYRVNIRGGDSHLRSGREAFSLRTRFRALGFTLKGFKIFGA